MSRFCLDSNVLMEAKNHHYAFDIAAGFWQQLEAKLRDETIIMSKLVYDELAAGDDELAEWVQRFSGASCVIEPDEETQLIYRQIADQVNQNQRFARHQVSLFLDGADPWVIALAKRSSTIVVTHETLAGANTTKVKIPNICQQFQVEHKNLFQMMRDLRFTLNSGH